MDDQADADAQLPEEMVIPFHKPIELGGITYESMTLREPTAAELIEADKLSGYASDVALLALVSGVPEPALRKMGARALLAGNRYITRFLK